MSGETFSDESCPACGDSLTSISDCFTGSVEHLDNFNEIEDQLREQGIVSDDEYDMYADRCSREEYENSLAEADREPPEGPFITESIVCSETWCDNCGYSRRTHHPLPETARNFDDPDLDDLDEDIKREAEALLDEMSS